MATSIDIIIVNWNSGEQLRRCIESIVSCNKEGYVLNQIIVVDNASRDESMDKLNVFDLPLSVIANAENRGFAVACNQGARGSEADYMLFLNPDTCLFSDSLHKPLSFMERPENECFGIVGMQLVDSKGKVGRTCARFPTPAMLFSKMLGLNYLFPLRFPVHFMAEWDHEESAEVNHVIGAFFLVRRLLFEKLNGFDERFFVYMEDLDFSLRIHQAGSRSFFLADVQTYHAGGGTSAQIKATRMFYSLRSRILYGYKHFDWFSATLLMAGTLFVEPLSRLALAIGRRSAKEAKETIRGYIMLWRAMPELFRNTLDGRRE
jgi:N-acetylglucosaminyl-diphospho-decaprenol L-rhamnosyltransferase